MKILITGIAGFVGCNMAKYFKQHYANYTILGIDNLSRRGSEHNLKLLQNLNCQFIYGDIRAKEDVDSLPACDWIIDCAAIPTVTAGISDSSLALINNNLSGTIFILEKCKRDGCGFILLSTSRVYSIPALNAIPITNAHTRFELPQITNVQGLSANGIAENFSTTAPISLYGAGKLASELLALEYSYLFNFPVWINRCGVIAGPGQFGKIDQGIFSYWIYKYALHQPLSYMGFQGSGKQVRDMLHPYDLFTIINAQLHMQQNNSTKLYNIGGGLQNALSLFELNEICKELFFENKIIGSIPENRPYDIPVYISNADLAKQHFNWSCSFDTIQILKEIASYAKNNKHLIANF